MIDLVWVNMDYPMNIAEHIPVSSHMFVNVPSTLMKGAVGTLRQTAGMGL